MKKFICICLSVFLLGGTLVHADFIPEQAEASEQQVETAASVQPFAEPGEFDYDRDAAYGSLAQWEDPDYLSDSDFFGVYDGSADTWTTDSKLDYDRVEGLAGVKEAVMASDYDFAKEELRDYYVERFSTLELEPPTFSRSAMLTAQLLEYDMQWNSNSNQAVLDIFTVPAEPGICTIDMAPTISSFVGQNNDLVVYLIALKKDGSVAEFESRNAGGAHPPVLKVTADGVTIPITASDDTYVSPGRNHAEIYGLDDTFKVEESVSSIGLGKDQNGKTISMPADLNTKRGLLKFDLTRIPQGSEITNAVIELYGSNVAETGNTGEMKIAAFKNGTSVWAEDTMTYYGPDGKGFEHMIYSWYGEGKIGYPPTKDERYYPITDPNAPGKAFCGHRFPEEIVRMGKWLSDPVDCYLSASDDNEHYAYIAIRQIVGMLDERGDDPFFDVNQPLDIANRSGALAIVAAKLAASEHMSPEIFTALVKYLWSSGFDLADHYNGGTNGGTFQITGFNTLNCYFGEFSAHYDWAARLREYSALNVELTLEEDGSGIEGGLNYVVNSLRSMANWTEVNELTGMTEPESLPYTPDLKEQISKGMMYVMHMTGPGYVDNQMGDGGTYQSDYKSRFEIGGRMLDNPYLLYAGTDGAEGTPDPTTSVLYPEARRLVMRTGWGENDLYLYNEVNGHKKHCHYDDSNIILFAYGNYLLTDPLFYTYTTGVNYSSIIKSSRMHNTVGVNGKNQTAVEGHGDVQLWSTNAAFDLSNLRHTKNADASHDRSIVFIKPGYYIVSDYLVPTDSEKTNQYRQYWHMLPNNNLQMDEQTGAARSHFDDKANLIIAQDSMDKQTGFIADDGLFSQGTNSLVDGVTYAVYEQNAAGPVAYNTVLYPERAGGDTNIGTQAIELKGISGNGASAMQITIEDKKQNTTSDAYYYMVHDFNQKALRDYGPYRTDALFNYVEKNKAGRLTRILMQSGTLVNAGDTPLVKALSPVEDLGVEYTGEKLILSTSQENFDLKDVTVYTDRTVTEVTLNGEAVPFRMSGAYVYFGSAPIIDGGTLPPTPAPKPDKPSHGSSGGGGGAVMPPVVPVPTPEPTLEPAKSPSAYFEDVTQAFAWAAPSIDRLYEKQIIAGKAKKLFDPGAQVSRSELVKMLVLAAGLAPDEAAELPFEDVAKTDWVYPYLAAAYQAGLIEGLSPTQFGGNTPVSREDFAVLCARVLDRAGVTIEETGQAGFADEESISEYAVASVRLLAEKGIVSGGGDGSFRPKDGATRAESAKMLSGVLELLEAE